MSDGFQVILDPAKSDFLNSKKVFGDDTYEEANRTETATEVPSHSSRFPKVSR